MKKVLFAAAFALFATTQAFAIIGVGAHYVYNTGTLKGANEPFSLKGVGGQDIDVSLNREEVSSLQGLGFKLWIDILPIIDIEGTFNVSATRYSPILTIPGINPIKLEYAPDAPYNMLFDKASPIYGLFSADVSVTYPVTSLPIIRPYAGLGLSYMASMPLVNKKFIENMNINLEDLGIGADSDAAAAAIGDKLVKALKDSDYKTGIGVHAIVGARFKLPFFPIAAYTNIKRYFGGDIDSKFSQGFVFELGGGFAI